MKTPEQLLQYVALAEASYTIFDGKDYQNNLVAIDEMVQAKKIPELLGKKMFDPNGGGTWSVAHTFEDDNNIADGGFAASVFKNASGEIVIGARGTEVGVTDLILADLANIGGQGLAYRQVTSLFNYIMRLKANAGDLVTQLDVLEINEGTSISFLESQGYVQTQIGSVGFMVRATNDGVGLGVIKPGDVVNITGHSLGGHLAYMAKLMFPSVVSEAYGFNSAGYDPAQSERLTDEFMAFFCWL